MGAIRDIVSLPLLAGGTLKKIVIGLALVLSGGSYKVMFQIPLLVFLEHIGIYPQTIYAISGGVPNALAYMLGKAARLPELWFRVDPEKFYSIDWLNLIRPLFRGGKPAFGSQAILKSELLDRTIDAEVDFKAILESPVRLWIGVEDLRAAGAKRVKWFSNKDAGMTPQLFRIIVLASMRIPIFFSPIDEGLAQYADPGYFTNFPVHKAVADGFDKIIAVNALPRELPDIGRLTTWPEIEVKHTDDLHVEEATRHEEDIEEINQHVAGIAAIKAEYGPQLPADLRDKLFTHLDKLPRSDKRVIDCCFVSPPAELAIFKKEKIYGYPTLAARFELLGAGCGAAELILAPFLERNKIFKHATEHYVDECLFLKQEFPKSVINDYFAVTGKKPKAPR